MDVQLFLFTSAHFWFLSEDTLTKGYIYSTYRDCIVEWRKKNVNDVLRLIGSWCFPWYIYSCIIPQSSRAAPPLDGASAPHRSKRACSERKNLPPKMRPFISFYTVSLSSRRLRLGSLDLHRKLWPLPPAVVWPRPSKINVRLTKPVGCQNI
jgi:hypothetical protein